MTCSNEQRTDMLLELVVEGCGNDELEFYNSIDTSKGISFSKKFERKMNRLLKKEKVEPFIVQFKRISTRVAIVCLVVLSMTFVAMMSVSAIRKAIWNTIVEWYNSYFEITVDDGDDSTITETITEIKQIHKPVNLPEGIEEDIVVNQKRIFFAEYYNVDERIASYRQRILDETSSVHVNSEDVTIYNKVVNQYSITIIKYSNGNLHIFWSDNLYFYTLEGTDLSVLEELISKIE